MHFDDSGLCGAIERVFRSLGGPRYDGQYLHKIVRETLGETRLHSTLTNIVIPTFDINYLQPTIFSSYEVYFSLSLSLSRIVLYISVMAWSSLVNEILGSQKNRASLE